MMDIERLEAVPTFVLLGKDDNQTVAAYVYERNTLVYLDASREAEAFVFLDIDNSEDEAALAKAYDSPNLERVDYESKDRKALVIRYHSQNGETQLIGYCYKNGGEMMYGEYLKGTAAGGHRNCAVVRRKCERVDAGYRTRKQ